MFVSLVPTSFHDFPGVRLVLFLRCVGKEADVVMDIKVKERSRLPPSFVDDEVIESIVLHRYKRHGN